MNKPETITISKATLSNALAMELSWSMPGTWSLGTVTMNKLSNEYLKDLVIDKEKDMAKKMSVNGVDYSEKELDSRQKGILAKAITRIKRLPIFRDKAHMSSYAGRDSIMIRVAYKSGGEERETLLVDQPRDFTRVEELRRSVGDIL